MLEFSSKFPPSLRRMASLLHTKADYSGKFEKASLIARLTARMDPVWDELTKHKRSSHKQTPNYLHPASPPREASAMSPKDAQTKALEELFYTVVSMVECQQLLSPPACVGADALLEKANRLRGNSRRSKSIGSLLSKAATAIASLPQPDRTRDVAIGLATYLKERFGKPMYETTATIASVALGKSVTKAMVRNWYIASMRKGGQNDQLLSRS
jgi:hypothetical protein